MITKKTITTNRGGYIFKMNTKKLYISIFFGTIQLGKQQVEHVPLNKTTLFCI